jgi:3-oxoacyl-[acyl-carrier protein] reductase
MKMFADFDAISVGDREELVRVITEADIRRFVEMTGDDNPLHVDREFAESTSFKDIVVHGMLGASFISTVIGTKLPGPGALWVTQNLEFLLPVRLGDELTVSCTVLKKNDRERLIELETRIVNQNTQTVLLGQGKVKVLGDRRPAETKKPKSRPQVAIVTGGAGGIGQAICRRLARDGFNVVVNYLSRKDQAQRVAADVSAGETKAIALRADVSTMAGAESLVAAAVKRFGGVDVLVNNAAPRINPKAFDALEWSDFQEHLDVQVKGAFFMSKACVPLMVAAHRGRIITITSQAIDGAPSPKWTSYAAAKAALAALSRYLAAELGPSGINVNCVSPGMTETGLIGDIPEKVQMMMARLTPLRRLALPEDIAAAVAYLASDEAAFVTGQTLRVNGGLTSS